MITLNSQNINEMKEEMLKTRIIMYGAGGNGERIFNVINKAGIYIDYFCDDDFNKWGHEICGRNIISFNQLKELTKNGRISVILTSVFAGPILGKLREISNIDIYEAFQILIEDYYQDSFYRKEISPKEQEVFRNKVNELIAAEDFDDESKKILLTIKNTVLEKQRGYSDFFDIASIYDCYFIPEVLSNLRKNPTIVDCGGFTGDLMIALDRHSIEYSRVYSFEVNCKLYDIMEKNIEKNLLQDKFIAVNKGVWNVAGYSFLDYNDDDIAGGHLLENSLNGDLIETVTINDYFKKTKVDFIKMDIEGAEYNALLGGIDVIRRDRPILAISLYHSIFDVVDIPLYLREQLDDYNFYIRHHSFIDSETVLYAIPNPVLREC